MRIYAAYIDPASLAEDRAVTLVKDGICWPALLFSFLWAAWHRMWWTALALFAGVAAALAGLAASGAHPATGLACVAALSVYIGGAANDWRCRGLERRGRRLAAVVAGRSADDAARRFLERGEGPVR
ncbi:MAG: DUF2628 domain-containing protein [Defluviicoccus sp.]|nr:DUF2628 domain-containing protein [Defluviicoccus sp.]MDE0386867.1 DUF2628 domain-containing protein [Defluviicoccus sp.]